MTTKKYYTSKGSKYGVCISTPDAPGIYDAVIAIHGIGGIGTTGNSDQGLNYVMSAEFPYQCRHQGEKFIICSPKLPKGNWYDNDFEVVQYAYDLLMKDFKPRRVYIASHSLGGQVSTGYVASSAARRAAISGSIQVAGVKMTANYASLKTYPVYFVHAPEDNVVNIQQAKDIYAAMGATPDIQPWLEIRYGHGYIAQYVGETALFWDWLSKQGVVVPVEPPVIQPAKTIKRITIEFSDGTSQVII